MPFVRSCPATRTGMQIPRMAEKKENDRLDAAERHELPDSDFGLPEDREYPMPDAAHVRAAEAYFRYAPKGKESELARNILKKAEQYGVDVRSKTILDWAEKGGKK